MTRKDEEAALNPRAANDQFGSRTVLQLGREKVRFSLLTCPPPPAVVNAQRATHRLLPYTDHRSRSSMDLSMASLT
jgi:hypothetical protein